MYPCFNTLGRAGHSRQAVRRNASHILLGWLFILLTTLFTISANAASTTTTAAPAEPLPQLASSNRSAPLEERQAANLIRQAATTLAASQPQQRVKAELAATTSGLINQQSERWLGQFGRARATLGIDRHFKKFSGGLSLLLPIDDSSKHLLTFSQVGFHHHHHQQPIATIGLGQRHQVAEWLLGYNAFFDHNVRRSHSRWGIGTEAWRDDLLFSGNGYFPISGWRVSKQLEGYEEKPARGFDVRAQFYLPTYRQIGGKLLYEHYFGEEVGLFGKEKRQKNPRAFTVGVDYTPIPLVTLGVDHRMGREKQKDTRLKLQLDYAFCSPWAHQIDSTRVADQRSLAANRYQWVERNEQMVMQYRQLPTISLSLPGLLKGPPLAVQSLEAQVTANIGFNQIEWDAPTFYTAGGKIQHSGGTRYNITFPAAPGHYTLTGIAIGQQDHRSQPATTTVIVEPITLTLPVSLQGPPSTTVQLIAAVNAPHGFNGVTWDPNQLAALQAAGGQLTPVTGNNKAWDITLPTTPGTYPLSGFASDNSGNQSAPAQVDLIVTAPQPPLAIRLKNNGQLPTIWLVGGQFELEANNGTPPYTWSSGGNNSASVDNSGVVTFENNAHQGGTITVTDAAQRTATFDLLPQPALKPMDDTKRIYRDAEAHCANVGARLPKYQNELLIARDEWRSTIAEVAGRIFTSVAPGREMWVWGEAILPNPETQGATGADLRSSIQDDKLNVTIPQYTVCLFE